MSRPGASDRNVHLLHQLGRRHGGRHRPGDGRRSRQPRRAHRRIVRRSAHLRRQRRLHGDGHGHRRRRRQASQTFTVTVDNVAPRSRSSRNQTVDEGALLSLTNIGQFTDPGFNNPLNIPAARPAETFTYSINWGDGTAADTGAADDRRPGGAGVPTAGSFDGQHTYADNGVYTVTVTVFDDDGGTATQTFTVTVGNVTPTLTVVGNQTINEGACSRSRTSARSPIRASTTR